MSDDLKSRLGGALCLVVGAAIAWFGIWLPVQAARAGAADVTWPLRAVVVPLAGVLGLFLLAVGSRYPDRDVERKTLTPVGWVLFAVIAVAAFGATPGCGRR